MFEGIETLLDSKLNTSVLIGNVIVPANSVTQSLRPFAEPALYHTAGFELNNFSLGGTLTKLKLRDRYFGLLTCHQIHKANFNYAMISVINEENRSFCTAMRAVFPANEHSVDELDAVLCEFTDPVSTGSLSSHGWFDLRNDYAQPHTPEPLAVVAIGYPGHRNAIDYENEGYAAGPNAVLGTESMPSISGRLSFEPVSPLDYDPNGFSGGPVFGLKETPNGLQAFFAGLVTEASRSKFHFISLQKLRPLIEKMLEDDLPVWKP
ncbi:hypothetical protein SAMN05444004_106196 [Jannaschia faecimaris]|uniref:Trypsin-like peptidase domain-containing protein n=1 Tax=Jannaschia faecimaris TaxID=1244108 RepID=A0A1H3QKN0_9RHOB|nr:hypothetical protein [Jannaschia faecimaris]SDZ14102.1 hypothetical protein SAMN05444004_106196 [Jannaschia faecimaris]